MVILFGQRERKSGELSVRAHCTRCQRDTVHRSFTQQPWFTVYFIPIFPLGEKRPHAICNVCGRDAKSATGPQASVASSFAPGAGVLVLSSDGNRSPAGCREIRFDTSDRYRLEVEGFADAIRGRCAPRVGLAESARNARVLERVFARM